MSKTIPSQDLKRARLERSRLLRNSRLLKDPTCSRCGETKTIKDFAKTGVVDYWCLVCRNKYALALFHKKRENLSPEQLQRLKDRENKRQTARRAAKIAAMSPDELAAFRKKDNDRNLASRNEVRDIVYKAYGGYVCNCCGETERKFLSMDHINNDGATHRRKHGHTTGEKMHRWLIRENFPSNMQVLCMNCQWGKRNNNGVCPHQVRCRDHPGRE